MTRRAKRSGRMAASRRSPSSAGSSGAGPAAARDRAGSSSARSGSPVCRRSSRSTRSASSSISSDGADELGVLPHPEDPGHELAGVGVGGDEHALVVEAAVAAEVAVHLPGDPLADADLGVGHGVPELPRHPVGVHPGVENVGLGALEVVLGLRRVGDLAADAREPEDAHGSALVGVADEVELPALEEQLVRVHLPLAHLVAIHRVVGEGDRLAPRDRRVDLDQALGEVVAAGRGRDAEGDRLLGGRAQRARADPTRAAGGPGAAARRRRTRRRAGTARSGARPAPSR